jgi:hypothetical protein
MTVDTGKSLPDGAGRKPPPPWWNWAIAVLQLFAYLRHVSGEAVENVGLTGLSAVAGNLAVDMHSFSWCFPYPQLGFDQGELKGSEGRTRYE